MLEMDSKKFDKYFPVWVLNNVDRPKYFSRSLIGYELEKLVRIDSHEDVVKWAQNAQRAVEERYNEFLRVLGGYNNHNLTEQKYYTIRTELAGAHAAAIIKIGRKVCDHALKSNIGGNHKQVAVHPHTLYKFTKRLLKHHSR